MVDFDQWVSPTTLAEWVDDATSRVISTVSDFDADDDRWVGPYLPEVNPPLWELGHVAWFAEWFVLRQLHGRKPLLDGVDERFDSAKVAHKTRWELRYPEPSEVIDYLRRVGSSLIDVVSDNRSLDSTNHYVAYAVMHHDAHYEALTYTRQTLGWGPRPEDKPVKGRVRTEDVSGDKPVSSGRYVVGASRSQPFVMDNEKWGHIADVRGFKMAVAPVTVSQFAEFVDDGGYSNDALWHPDGLAWRRSAKITAPAYWRRGSDSWERRIGAVWHPIESAESSGAEHPMVHVNYWEAEAYCRWAGRRLPTENEWEVAATTDANGERRPWFPWGQGNPGRTVAALDGNTDGTVGIGGFAPGDGPWGHRQMIGNVWEWTSSTFAPYPHFEPDAYRDNSEPWFGDRKVLKGGSWATRGRYVRSTFRNYFTPDRRDIYAGFRTCAA